MFFYDKYFLKILWMIKPNYFLLTVQTNGSGAPCMYWPPWPPSGNWFHQHGGGSALATTTEVTTLNIVRSKAFIHRCFSNQIMEDGERLLSFCLSRYLAFSKRIYIYIYIDKTKWIKSKRLFFQIPCTKKWAPTLDSLSI